MMNQLAKYDECEELKIVTRISVFVQLSYLLILLSFLNCSIS